MSAERGGLGASPALPAWLRAVLAAGLAGLLAGFLWGVADVPRYTSSAAVVVSSGGAPDPAELDRYASIGGSSKVATKAAGILGDDVPGADLLSDVAVVPSPSTGGVLVEASADAPDAAAAAADGYAQALVAVGGKRLELGAAATLPGAPSENRSALLWAVIGLLAGASLGGAIVAVRPRRRPFTAREPASGDARPLLIEPNAVAAPEPEPEPEPDPLPEQEPSRPEDAFGVTVIAGLPDPAAVVAHGEDALALNPAAAPALARLAEELGLEHDGAPRTVAVLEADAGAGADAVLLGLAITAGELGVRAIVVEADLAQPTLAAAAGVAPAPGLGDYLRAEAGPRDVLRSAPVEGAGGPGALVCVPAGAPVAEPSLLLAGPRFAALLERLPRAYDVVLLSGPPVIGAGPAELSVRVDATVLVASGDEGSHERIAEAVEGVSGGSLAAGVLIGPASSQSHPQGVR